MIAGSAGTRAAASKRRQDAAQKKKLSKEDEQFIQAVYVKYDINKDGELAKDELMKLLTDLNDGTGGSMTWHCAHNV